MSPEAAPEPDPLAKREPASHGPRKTLYLLQALRAIAALMVVVHHATILAGQRLQHGFAIWIQGASGVDIFFVLSGLVMVLSTAGARRTGPRAAVTFLRRRCQRIVPLYWLATTAKLIGLVLLPGLAVNAIGSRWHVLASYLFLPSPGPTRTLEPLVVVGWTLNLEMFFYVLFAVALGFGTSAVVTVLPSLVVLAGLRYAQVSLPWIVFAWGDPVVLDFLYGLLLGWLLLRGVRPAPWLATTLVLAGFTTLAVTPSGLESAFRPLLWGLPAAAIVAGAAGLEATLRHRLPPLLLHLGDASYSIYLTHSFLLPVLGAALLLVPVSPQRRSTLAILAAIPLSAALGWLIFRLVELPVLRWFGLRGQSGDPVLPA